VLNKFQTRREGRAEVWYKSRVKSWIIALSVLVGSACTSPGPEVEPDYRAEIEQWRAQRLERLTAEDGWLTLVGLHWLQDGPNRFGSDPGNEVVLDAPGIPPIAGTFEVTGDGIIARAPAGAAVTVNGEPFTETIAVPDANGNPDIFSVGRLRLFIIDRNGRLGVRVKDPESEARREFAGIDYFPIDPAYRVTAILDRYAEPRDVEIPTVIGEPDSMLAPGLLHLTVKGTSLTLEPYVSAPDDDSYFFVVRDRTSGNTTYGGGRFLSTSAAGDDGTTVVDFNYLFNPPCAFTAFATCPLPTPQNTLPIAIEAGEKFAGHGH